MIFFMIESAEAIVAGAEHESPSWKTSRIPRLSIAAGARSNGAIIFKLSVSGKAPSAINRCNYLRLPVKSRPSTQKRERRW